MYEQKLFYDQLIPTLRNRSSVTQEQLNEIPGKEFTDLFVDVSLKPKISGGVQLENEDKFQQKREQIILWNLF